MVVDTDKSKRFSILSRDQYIESGLVHTRNDKEIDFERVKRIQNYVNDHSYWISEITNCGLNWDHQERMKVNLSDNGEQVCKMVLLMKDHKSWTPDSNKSSLAILGSTDICLNLSL